jgi:hypothetical protein
VENQAQSQFVPEQMRQTSKLIGTKKHGFEAENLKDYQVWSFLRVEKLGYGSNIKEECLRKLVENENK